MQIFLGADHRGFPLKQQLAAWLQEKGQAMHDVGAATLNPDDDYTDFAFLVAEAVSKDPGQRSGILICGSGAGMAVAANKVKGIRACLIHNPNLARAAREDDDINVLVLGSDFISETEAKQVVESWLAAKFDPAARHVRRIQKIEEYEKG